MQRNLNFSIPKILKTGLTGFHSFWFATLDPFIIGVFRFILGFYFVCYLLMLAPNWLVYYGPDGISGMVLIPLEEYKFPSSVLLAIHTDAGMWYYYFISLVLSFCLMFGVLGKIPIIWLWIMNFSIMYRNLGVVNGEEQVMGPILFFALFLPLNKTFRLSQLINKERRRKMFDADEKTTISLLMAFQVYMAAIYLFSIPQKFLTDFAWRDGTVVYYSQMLSTFPRWPGLFGLEWGHAIISRVLTYVTQLIESLFPFLVWFPKFRLHCTLAAILSHIGLAIFFEGLMMFNIAFIVALIVFLPSRRTKEFLKKFLY